MKKLYEVPLCDVAHIKLGSVLCGSGDVSLSSPANSEQTEKPMNAF